MQTGQSLNDDPCPQPKDPRAWAMELDLGAVEEGCLVKWILFSYTLCFLGCSGTGIHCGKVTIWLRDCEALNIVLLGNPVSGHPCGRQSDTRHLHKPHCRPGTPFMAMEFPDAIGRIFHPATLHTLFRNGLKKHNEEFILLSWSPYSLDVNLIEHLCWTNQSNPWWLNLTI